MNLTFFFFFFADRNENRRNFAAKYCIMEKIVISSVDRKSLVKRYGACLVSRALSFKSNSIAAKEIRNSAMNSYKGYIVKF